MIESDEVVTLRLPAAARYIRMARLVGAGLANELEIDLDALDDVRLAIGEACALAMTFGAEWLDLQFALADDELRVTCRGQPLVNTVDDDHVQLVRHILDVACARHEINKDEGRISLALTFTSGT